MYSLYAFLVILGIQYASGVPSVVFYSGTDMNKEMKDNLHFAIFTGENEYKYRNGMAKYIAGKMRTIYGGYWSVFASRDLRGNKFNWSKGNYASFGYASRHWHVYKNDCGSSVTSTMTNNPVGFSYTRGSFDSSTNMSKSVKDDLLFAIGTSQASMLGVQGTMDRIHERMQRVYGGGWSAHFSDTDDDRSWEKPYWHFNSIPGYYAIFTETVTKPIFGTLNASNRTMEYFVFKQMC